MPCHNRRLGARCPGVDANPTAHGLAHARARTQSGFSLTESLAALMLVTVVILGIAAGILTAVRATRVVSETQRAEAKLTDATEAIKAKTYVECASPTSYAVPEVANASVTAVRYLRADSGGTEFVDACPPAGTDLAQRITVVVGNRSAEVVKRNPASSGATP